MSGAKLGHSKVTAVHLSKQAYVYIRQSTVKQVVENEASQENQRRMVERAVELGWPSGRIQVIDEDQGLSGRSSDYRRGYQRLVTEVSLAQVGIIIGYEVSRLARNNSDWYHLLDLAAVFGTLIADHDGVYNPGLFNDRLLLGLKGTMSEVELHLLQQRLEAGRMRKVEQGVYRQTLPTGLVRVADGRVELDPDDEVRHCIELVLSKFAELGSCGRVRRELRAQGIRIPRRQARGLDKGEIVWKEATNSVIYEIVSNPAYAGAFVYGRKQVDPTQHQPGRPASGRRRKTQHDWLQITHDAYPAYISWEQYQANQAQLQANGLCTWKRSAARQGGAREGNALLQGMAICGHCGRHYQVNYRERRNHRYQCHAVYRRTGERGCPTIHGPLVDQAVVEAFFAALRPANLDALEGVLAGRAEEQAQRERQWEERLTRARYEAQRAQRQYLQVEPENRLVAAELERRWEEKLQALQAAEEEIAQLREKMAAPRELTAEMREQFTQISERLPELWDQFTPAQHKTLLRSLIDHVVLTRQAPDQVEVRIVWVSGYYTNRVVRVPTSRREEVGRYDEMVERIGELHQEGLRDRQIAQQLEQEGFHTAHRSGVAVSTIRTIRQQKGWHRPVGPRRKLEVSGWLTTRGLAERLGVERRWVNWRLKNGAFADHYVTRDRRTGEYLIKDDPELIEQLGAMIGKRIRFSRKEGS